MNTTCTLSTACFDLTKYNNRGRPLSTAINNMTSLLKTECYLVIYTDPYCIDLIKEIRKEFDSITKYIVLEFEQLECYKYINLVKKNRKEYWPTRDERTCSESHLLCSNKFNFVLQTIESNPFNTSHFGWIDGTNLGANFSAICKNYNPQMFLDFLNINDYKFHIQILNVNDKKYKNNKRDYYRKYRYVVCGGLFITEKEIGIKILNRLNEIFIDTTILGYGHGEEMYYLEVLDEFYDDFEKSYGDYGQIINNFIHPTTNLHYIYYLIINNYLKFEYYKECYDCCIKVLYSIENNLADEYYEELYMNVLYAYYISARNIYSETNNIISPSKIIDHIYNICKTNTKMGEEFNKKKQFYEQQFSNTLKKTYKLIINIFACPTIEKYKNEILKINETWGSTAKNMGVKLLFFFGEEKTDLIGEEYIYLPKVNNDYESASWKQYFGLKYIYENYNSEFIFTCGTDTFININNLLIYLDTLNSNEKLYIGGHGALRKIGNNDIYFHSGGAGFILTNPILEELYPNFENLQNSWKIICENNNITNLLYACDVSIAYFLMQQSDIKIIKNNNFYGCNYIGIYYNYLSCCTNKIIINSIISCHNMSTEDFENYQKILESNKYKLLCELPSDINEHLPTLYQLATECNSVLELGVRGVVSSWAFVNGLLDNNDTRKFLFLNDLQECNINELLEYTKKLPIDIKYQWINCLDLDFNDNTFDLVFIDTWHIYGQLKRELAKFSKISNKYIVMHDTTVDEFEGETIRCGMNAEQQSIDSGFPINEILQGLGRAIDEFLLENSNWILKKKYTNNNGLTILEKIC